jgi:hypothetical protein
VKAGGALVRTADVGEAARQAVQQAREPLGGLSPSFGVLFASAHFFGSAADGVGFNTPVTGTIAGPSRGGTGALIVPVLNASGPGSTGTFTVKLATGATATGTIMPGAEVPSDCSLSATNNTAISITCTDRPAGQTWYAWAWCPAFKIVLKEGNEVTGDGTSTVVCDAYSPLYGEAWFASLS